VIGAPVGPVVFLLFALAVDVWIFLDAKDRSESVGGLGQACRGLLSRGGTRCPSAFSW